MIPMKEHYDNIAQLVVSKRRVTPGLKSHKDIEINKAFLDASTGTVDDLWAALRKVSLQMKQCGFFPSNIRSHTPEVNPMTQAFFKQIKDVISGKVVGFPCLHFQSEEATPPAKYFDE